jgi:hypothetical protein
MYNPEKLATHGTQDEEQHNTICVRTTLRKQTNTNNINKTWALPQTTGGKIHTHTHTHISNKQNKHICIVLYRHLVT